MKWMAAGNVSLYGVSYSAEQSVNVGGWSKAQIHHQVYLGNIVPDWRVGQLWNFSSEGGSWTGSYEDYVRFAFSARGAFTAPYSGRIRITNNTMLTGARTDSLVRCRVELRTTSTITEGTQIYSSIAPASYARGNQLDTASHTWTVTGLVPGDPYNVVHAFASTTGGATVGRSRIIVESLGL